MGVIKLLLSRQNINNITDQVTYIFDNDSNGYKYALKLDTFLKGQELPNIEGLPVEELKDKVLQLPNVELLVNSDWNDDLQASIMLSLIYICSIGLVLSCLDTTILSYLLPARSRGSRSELCKQ